MPTTPSRARAPSAESLDARVLEDQRRDLREREDEDEVEEELEVAGLALLLLLGRLLDERSDVAHAQACATARSSERDRERRARTRAPRAGPSERTGRARRASRAGSAPPPGDRRSRRPQPRATPASWRRDDRSVEIRVVVDGRDRDVDLRRPVGRVPAVRRDDPLVARDELPPDACRDPRPDRRTARARTRS